MTWADLAFLHWRVEPGVMRRLVPPAFELDLFDGSAWVGLVPFKMVDCRFRGFEFVPTLREFYECNVRTYVKAAGLAGVWFFSLDAANLLPVVGGRLMWNLNYVRSRFRVVHEPPRHDYALTRHPGPWPAGRTHVRWRVGGVLPQSQPGTLEHFLTERYELFTRRGGRVLAGRVQHAAWPLRSATVEHLDDTLLAAAGLPVTGMPEVAYASERIEVRGEGLREILSQ